MTSREREQLIRRYAEGAERLRRSWEGLPAEARQWRPGPGRWSAHEVVVHAADSETNGAMRLRYVLAEKDPVIQNYDEAEWARRFGYHDHSPETALAIVAAVRAHTASLLKRLTEEDWRKSGRHSVSGAYTTETWLSIYAEHLEKHAGQIERNLAEWKSTHA